MQRAAFSNFDPRVGSNFDPRVANKWNGANGAEATGSVVQDAKPGQRMQVNILLNNPTASTLTFELFNYLDSFVRNRNLTYVVGNYLYVPQTSHQGIERIAAGTDQTVGFDETGNCCIRGLAADPVATIGCSEIPYSSLFEASSITPFHVAYIRQTVTTDAQISNNITWFQKTMAGGIVQNNISPRAYFRPNQFQPLTIDITVEFTIGVDSGLKLSVLSGELVTLSLFISSWTDQTIGQ